MSALSIKHISQMLDNPQSVTIDQAGKIKALKEQYPYFTPALHLEAAVLQNVQPFSAAVLNIMHSSNTNWMLLYNYLEKIAPVPANIALQNTEPAEPAVIQTAAPLKLIELDIDDESAETAAGSNVIVEKRVAEPETSSPIPATPLTPEAEEDDIMAELRKPLQIPAQQPNSDFFGGDEFESLRQDFVTDDVTDNIDLPEFSEDIVSHGLAVESDELTTAEQEYEEEEEVMTSLPLNLFGEEHAPAEHFEEESLEAEEEDTARETTTTGDTDEQIETQEEQQEPIEKNSHLIQPIYTEDYFLHEGVEISNELPEPEELIPQQQDDGQQSLMVMRSFSEWLSYFKTKSKEQQEEEEDKKALKTLLQKQKLAAAIEEENEEIPEQVFEMAVNSITQEDGLASESLAEIYVKQAKYDKAIDMYRKLSLRNPQKNTYFARKIEEILKEKQS
jgi:hypothetical protein